MTRPTAAPAGSAPTGVTTPWVYGIPNCDTVKKARGWLTDHGVSHQFHDFKKQGVPLPLVEQWIAARGWETLLNRRGPTWRKLDAATQASVIDAASAIAVMAANSSVIKRPVVQWPSGETTVGFDATAWERLI
jgi:arsenate reductase (glutaredoxin)